VSRLGNRLRRLDDAFVGPPKVYEAPTRREARVYAWLALAGSVLAVSVLLLLPDHNWVRYLLTLLGVMLVQPFAQDRVNRRVQRRAKPQPNRE
jgi:hypothetical protein